MPKPRNKQGKKTLKEINAISERLYSSSNANTTRLTKKEMPGKTGKHLSKDDMNSMVERLHESDPNAKRKELGEKHNMNFDKERPENMGWQKKEKEEIDAVTSRLFVADYNNRNLGKQTVPKVTDKELSKEEFDGMVERLFISGYSNRNLVKNQQFYDLIMNKKKAEEKSLNKEEVEETLGRLSKQTREPAECNKDMLGKQTYNAKGIYGTHAMNGGNERYIPEDGSSNGTTSI